MKNNKINYLILFSIFNFFVCSLGYASDEIITGDAMADQTKVVEKVGITFIPHAELEYRYDFSGVGGIDVDGIYPAAAFGLALNHKNYTLDFFGRKPFSQPGDIDDKGTYGLMLTYLFMSNKKTVPYLQLGVDTRDVTFIGTDENTGLFTHEGEQYNIDTTNLRLGFGYGGPGMQFTLGVLGYFGDINGEVWTGKEFETGSDEVWGLGFYSNVQINYPITPQLKWNIISLQLEYRTGVSDNVIAGKEVNDYLITVFARTGLTYMF